MHTYNMATLIVWLAMTKEAQGILKGRDMCLLALHFL